MLQQAALPRAQPDRAVLFQAEAVPPRRYPLRQARRYNSCRNRHCPRCQGAAARAWLAEREADLLPVGYFHVVFTLPAEVADVAFQNKAAIYGLLFRRLRRR